MYGNVPKFICNYVWHVYKCNVQLRLHPRSSALKLTAAFLLYMFSSLLLVYDIVLSCSRIIGQNPELDLQSTGTETGDCLYYKLINIRTVYIYKYQTLRKWST
jgi:hypothetical protein